MPLKSRRSFPTGGFKFFEPRTGWSAMGGLTFDQVVDAIIKHRKANRFTDWATDIVTVQDELDNYTCQRIGNDPNYCDGNEPPPFRTGLLSSHIASRRFQGKKEPAVGVRNVVTGIGIITEWLGSGAKPVAKELAEKRAAICVDCPHNGQGDLTSIFTVPASEMILKTIAIKNDMKLTTSHDSKLGVCDICDCPMKSKVWTPISHIESHLSDRIKAQLPDFCWQKQEFSKAK